MATETFALQSLPGSAWAVGIGGAVLLGGLGALLTRLAIGLKRVRFEVQPDALRIHAPFYGRSVPKRALVLDQAKVLTGEAGGLGQRYRRSNGVGLPGYRVGWFKNEAGAKTLLFVTDRDKVLSIPTTEGYSLLLSTDAPAELLAALKE